MPTKAQLQAFIEETNKMLGAEQTEFGSVKHWHPPIPTGSLALDYALGTGGWPRGHMIGIYGKRDIGKSSILGLSAIKNAQNMGLGAAIIAVEPNFDPEWATSHGVDPEMLVVARPDTAERAFDVLYKCVTSDIIDVVLFDSIGALLGESEVYGKKGKGKDDKPAKDGGDGKPRMGGQSGIITHGIKRVAHPIYMGGKVVIFLNQVRHDLASLYGGMQQPGGEALEHGETIIMELKRGKRDQNVVHKVDGEEILIANEVVAVIERNKASQGTKRVARFNFYNMQVEGHPFGIDTVSDVLATGQRLGLIQRGGAYYTILDYPKLYGKDGVRAFIEEKPEVVDELRVKIMEQLHGSTGDE